MTLPQISVVLPVYKINLEWFIQSVNSIVHQTFTDFELIIILDNPDSIELESIIRKYQEQDNRILLIKNQQNIGLPKSLNKGIQMSKGKYIARMDADDISVLNRFELQYEYLEANPLVCLCGGQAIKVDKNGYEIGATNHPTDPLLIKRLIPYINPTTHPTWMIRSEQIKEIGLYRNLPNAEDLDVISRMSINNMKIKNLPTALIKYRMHFESQSGKKSIEQRLCFKYIQRLHRQRMDKGADNFSEEHLKQYLKVNRPTNPDSHNLLWKARIFGKNNLAYKLYYTAKTFLFSRINRSYLIDLIKARIIQIIYKIKAH